MRDTFSGSKGVGVRVIQYTATQSTQTNTSMAARGQKCTGGPKIWAINIVRANLSLTDSVRLRLLLPFAPPHFLGQEIFSSASCILGVL